MIGHFLRGHPFQVRNLDRSEKVRSHQKNPKFRLAQKLVGLTTLVLLAVSFGPQPAGAKQKSAAEVAKNKEAAGLAPVKEALTKAVATYFGEGLDGTKTNKFFEGWTDSDWRSFIGITPGFYMGAKNLETGDPGRELYKKNSKLITGAIAETFHWVQWRKKFAKIAEVEKYTDIEFLDEKKLREIFGYNSGQRCDGLAIATKSGKPPERVILGVFESKLYASKVKSKQIQNFLEQIRDYYRDGKDVSMIRLPNGETKLIQQTNESDSANFIEAAKSFHKEAAQSLNGKDSNNILFNTVSREFASNVMGLDSEQKQKLLEEALPLKKLAEFTKKYEQLPKAGGPLEGEGFLAEWLTRHLKEYEKEIKAYLRDRGGIDHEELEWMFEVKAKPWKKQLPDVAEFIRVNKRFPKERAKDPEEHDRATWLSDHFKAHKEEILAYLRDPGGVDSKTLSWALEVKANLWKEKLPDVADFIRVNKEFPKQGGDLPGENDRATWLSDHFKAHKEEILAYLRGPGDVDSKTLSWALEVRANPWKKKLPDVAEFIRVNERFPTQGQGATEQERKLAEWLYMHFNGEIKSKEINAYLDKHVEKDILLPALEEWEKSKRAPWQDGLPKLAEFLRDEKRFPKANAKDPGEKVLASWLSDQSKNHGEAIKAYLRGRTDIDQAELEWMFEVRAEPWKKQLPDIAKFIRDNERFPSHGQDASKEERTLAQLLRSQFKGEKIPVINSYLEENVHPAILKEARADWESRKRPRKNKIPATDADTDRGTGVSPDLCEELKAIGLTPAA